VLDLTFLCNVCQSYAAVIWLLKYAVCSICPSVRHIFPHPQIEVCEKKVRNYLIQRDGRRTPLIGADGLFLRFCSGVFSLWSVEHAIELDAIADQVVVTAAIQSCLQYPEIAIGIAMREVITDGIFISNCDSTSRCCC
jgi:hypothetical protein